MNRDERKRAAEQTLEYIKQGYYVVNGNKIDIKKLHQTSVEGSILLTPNQSDEWVEQIHIPQKYTKAKVRIVNESTLKVILDLHNQHDHQIGVLNFASAKNPGGGFLNGSLAQEESLAIASGLYDTQLHHDQYYQANRACGTMMYTDHMIYSPQVVFIRDEVMNLLDQPATASILTAPAVNLGQVILKKEDQAVALMVMKNRMRKILALFAAKGDKNIILGAFGCGVFKNSADTVANYWHELLYDENYVSLFDHIIFAILDRSRDQEMMKAFVQRLGYRIR